VGFFLSKPSFRTEFKGKWHLRHHSALTLPAQGRFGALDKLLPPDRHHAPKEGEDIGDRQVGLHRRCQRREGHAGQPRIL
jgi:hypothetical protein